MEDAARCTGVRPDSWAVAEREKRITLGPRGARMIRDPAEQEIAGSAVDVMFVAPEVKSATVLLVITKGDLWIIETFSSKMLTFEFVA
jgi:hypothetical protein